MKIQTQNEISFKTKEDKENKGFRVEILCNGSEIGRRLFPTLDQAQFYVTIMSDAVKIVRDCI